MMPLIVLCVLGCKDDESEEAAFDPSKPIVITDFEPKEGGVGNNLILYGDNFGNDPTKLKVIIGGKEANIINVKNQILYCVVPRMAVDGDVEISVYDGEGEEIAYAEAEEGIIIGTNDNVSHIRVTYDRIAMYSAGEEVMYISQGVIHIDNGVFTKTLQIGRFRTEQHQTNLDINVCRYVG
jgi:hypothetical protein